MSKINSASPHSVLNYLITRAVLQGKTGTSELSIPLHDLVDPAEGIEITEIGDLCLKITISTDWDSGDEQMLSLIENEEGDEDEDGESSDSNQTGH
jgi:hypothetical protein